MENNISKKLKTIAALSGIIEGLKNKGKKVVQCHGVFDIMHLGHIRHLNLAKKEGDILVVTITRDRHVKRGPGRPIFNEHLRAETLASLEITDYVSIIDAPTAIEAIKILKPDVYVKGTDYKEKKTDITGKIFEEEEAVKLVGGRLHFTDDITFSSTNLINSYLDVLPPRTFKYLKVISKRYPIDSIIEKLNSLRKMRALVIGDAIIDQYHYCMPLGKSSKEHLVVNHYVYDEVFAGGALATASNVASLCGRVDLLTVLGKKDSYNEFISSKLPSNIKPVFFYRTDAETVIKRRFVHKETNAKLFEICYMKDDDISVKEEKAIEGYLLKNIKKYDVVIVSDFGHGLITKRLMKLICSRSRYLALNVQTNSANTGFNLVTKYSRADMVCIDKMELRLATHDKSSGLRKLSRQVYSMLKCKNIIVTLGPHGSLCYSKNGGFHETPAFSYRVVDAVGAGDAFFAFVSPCFAAGMPQDLVSFVGNTAGSLAVQIICNREPVGLVDISKFITRLLR
jgi:rfaE bifunctional protein kinase chain/domain/rfaE bifunctional protein nucleotidyltransferase chain/domain